MKLFMSMLAILAFHVPAFAKMHNVIECEGRNSTLVEKYMEFPIEGSSILTLVHMIEVNDKTGRHETLYFVDSEIESGGPVDAQELNGKNSTSSFSLVHSAPVSHGSETEIFYSSGRLHIQRPGLRIIDRVNCVTTRVETVL